MEQAPICDNVYDHAWIYFLFCKYVWVGQEMAAGLDFWGFIKALLLGGAILGSKRAFGEKGSYISSALTSFTQIGWFGVGIAMFAIPVARELFGGSTAVEWVLILIAGACMTASAYFGIKSLTVISYIAVPLVANLGTVAMIMAVKQGDGTIVDQFAKSSGSLTDQNLCLRRNCNTELHTICKKW